MSRLERFGRRHSRSRQQQDTAAAEQAGKGLVEGDIPPRNNKHFTTRQQLTRLYYHFLIVFFVGLVVGLLAYGYGLMGNSVK